MNIEKIVIDCAAQVYGVSADSITVDTNIREELSNQSIRLIAFISFIEDETDAKIEIKDAATLKTIGDFVKRVEELTA